MGTLSDQSQRSGWHGECPTTIDKQIMIATKKTKSHAKALPDMAKDDEAEIADAVDADARRPPPLGDGLGSRSIPQEAGGRYTSDDPSPSMPSATLPPKSLDEDDEERSGGSSIDDEFLSYISGDIPVPPLPSVVAMAPAPARSETNRASVDASMMHATAGLVTSEAAAKIADAVDAGDRRPSPRGIALGSRSIPQEAMGRRTSNDPPPRRRAQPRPPSPAVPGTQRPPPSRPRTPNTPTFLPCRALPLSSS